MNKGKESVSQRSLLSNIRISSDDLLLQNRKANLKSGSRSGISPTKNGPQKESEFPLPKVIPTKAKLPNQNSSRASSADKLSGPLAGGLKMKAMLNGKVEGNANRLNDQQENRKDQESPRKDISPNRERPLRGVSKTREGQLRKEALEVVSEENEEYFRETLNGLNKASHSKSVQKMHKEPLTPIYNTKRTEFVLQELFSVKAKGTAFGREEEDVESPIKNSEKLEVETVPTFRQNEDENDNNSTTPKKQTETEIDNNFKASSAHVRGVFMKEHISSVQRQKEQDQKKLMKEYLDSQVNEKKRLKEEERLRKIEESKKEELRLKREVEQLNIQYEKEINHVKTRPQEVKTEPSLRETRHTVLRKEDKIENKNKEQNRESQKEMNFSSVKPARNESPKDEAFNRKTPDENPVLPLANIRKLAEENKQLRSQNDRKNELIDILLVALKNQGKEGLAASELLEADLYSGDPHSRSNSRQKLMAQSRNGENLEMGAFRKQDQMADDRSNASPWTLGSHFIRFDTDHANVGSDENFEFEETQLSAYRATETLSKLVNPGGISEIKLPLLPELYSHRKAPTFLSSSNLQQLETPNAGQPSSRFPSTPYTKVSPRQFSLNISSPTNSHAAKQRSEFIPITATPKQPFSRMTHFSRSKLEDGLTVEPFNAGRLVMDTESHRISTSASQVHPKKLSDNHFLPIMQFPNFRNATANNQRIIPEIRNPIRVVDMGAHQQVQTSRSKAGYIERADNKLGRLTAEDTKDPRLNFPLKDKEPRYRRDFLSIGGDVLKNVHGIDLNNDKDYHEGELLAKRVDSLSNRNKFPKDVFCMNLRKKVNSQGA